ncbi:MAG: leucine-rich repeat domain-containing protein [Bacteroidales bacterium]|nr:leucine-rich repeat domain-containing protein [Bacteroidales bacterium]
MKLRVAIVLVAMLFATFEAQAYDFALRLNYGDSLFFTITDPVKDYVKIVPPESAGINSYAGHEKPVGRLSLPSHVTYNDKTFTVTAIGTKAFYACDGITGVTLPPTVTTIEPYAFYGCSGMKGSIVLGENIESVGASAFYGCTGLTEIKFKAIACTEMGNSMSNTVFGNCSNVQRITIASGVTIIPDYAFCGLDEALYLSALPETLTTIGAYAFAYCSNIAGQIVIPNSVATIGECAFHQCHSIGSVVVGKNVRAIGNRAFFRCINLGSVRMLTYVPPTISDFTFAETGNKLTVSIPCVSRYQYLANSAWKKLQPSTYGECEFKVAATMSEPHSGKIIGVGKYSYGDTVELTVVCAPGYGFDGWSDGLMANPRQFVAYDNLSVTAKMRPSGTIVVHDTLIMVDTVYSDGIKIVRDTVELNEVARSVASYKEIAYNPTKKTIAWTLRRGENPVSASLYNQQGECVYTSNGKRNKINLSRFATGSYIIRIETDERVLRARFFISSDKGQRAQPQTDGKHGRKKK